MNKPWRGRTGHRALPANLTMSAPWPDSMSIMLPKYSFRASRMRSAPHARVAHHRRQTPRYRLIAQAWVRKQRAVKTLHRRAAGYAPTGQAGGGGAHQAAVAGHRRPLAVVARLSHLRVPGEKGPAPPVQTNNFIDERRVEEVCQR
jgi:hypothetical protein